MSKHGIMLLLSATMTFTGANTMSIAVPASDVSTCVAGMGPVKLQTCKSA